LRTRRLLLVAGMVTLILAGPAPARAQDARTENALNELDSARRLLDDSLELYEEGRTNDAYTAARNSYLEHFEFVEIPLRVRDETLTLQVEEDFANLRNQIDARAELNEVEQTAAEVRRGLDNAERTLSDPGLAAPLLALGYAFTILFREGLEAVLVVAALLGYLEASRNTRYRRPVLKGVAAATVATVVTFVLATAVVRVAPIERELIEAITAALAVAVLFYVSFWLVTRLEHRRWMEFVKAKVWNAATTGSTLALAGVGFTAVYREGFETVLFYQALLAFARGLQAFVIAGTALGVGALGAVAWLIFRAGRRIPVKTFLGTAVVLVMALSVAFAGNAVRGLQEAAVVPVTFIDKLPSLPIFLSQLTGWYPTRETIVAQSLLTLVYVAGAMWTFVVLPRREHRTRAVAAETDVSTDLRPEPDPAGR
jgi:high-affinity iron transporter